MRLYFKYLIERYKPDFLWITFPLLYDYIPPKCNRKIIYDCMDNITPENFEGKFKKIIKSRNKIIAKSRFNICSF